MKISRHTLMIFTLFVGLFSSRLAYGIDGPELPIPPNLKMSVELLSPLSTAANKKGDKFSCKILTPAEYAGAIVEGHIRNLKGSGKANKDSSIDLAFEKVTLPDGRSGDFSATVVEVFDVGQAGDQGRADNEGTVRNKPKTVKTSVKRAAAGALIGGLIGAVVAGGQGAAIGAAIGAGIGVTTTLAVKGPDLEFKEGTQFTVECNGPTRKKKEPTSGDSKTAANSTHPIAEQPAPDPPSSSYRTYTGRFFSVKVPDNWRDYASETSVAFAPERGYVLYQGRPDFTHAVMVGTMHVQSNSLDAASAEYTNAMLKVNSYLSRKGDNERSTIGGRDAVRMFLAGTENRLSREKNVIVYNVLLRDGTLLYLSMVVPAADLETYQNCFDAILKSIELHDQ
ncbi:MAG: hypothetical protein QOH41_1485 [Blastocatellia bacterium]|jgi:hypothetical protein|nr:hypothetical protein [Blastocatellia bacterium]